MHIAVVNNATGLVENTIVPPSGNDVWQTEAGYTAIETDVGSIGDTWNGLGFIKPEPHIVDE